MRISVRLDAETEQMLARLVGVTRKTKSGVIRDAVRALGEQSEVKRRKSTVYDRLADVIGIVSLGRSDRARHSEEILRARFASRRVSR